MSVRTPIWAGTLAVAVLSAASTRLWAATPTYYNDRPTFEAALGALVVDDYAPPVYPAGFGIYDNATFSAFRGETDYETTGFPDFNFHKDDDTYCAGCNGSFRFLFQTTSVSVGGVGVVGAGVDILVNDLSAPYHAFITYGDGTTADIGLQVGSSFFGVSAPELVASIHFGLSGGGATTTGNFAIDNLTIGAAVPVELQSFTIE